MKPLVLITDFVDGEYEREQLRDIAEVVVVPPGVELGYAANGVTAVIVYAAKCRDQVIPYLQGPCRVIVRGGVGVDNVDCELARSWDIPVVNVPGFGPQDVADTTMAMILSLVRGVNMGSNRLRQGGRWDYKLVGDCPFHLNGMSLGIVGLGRIGTAVALRAKALGMEVVFYDPYKPDGYDHSLDVDRVESLDDLAWVDIISLHCPLTDETRGMMDGPAGPIPRYLINTARGGLVSNQTILDRIESGELLGAGLDVLEKEPPDPDDHLLGAWRNPLHPAHDRVIITPHAAWYTETGLETIRRETVDAVRRALTGQPLKNVVN